jgi:hypothetical protein
MRSAQLATLVKAAPAGNEWLHEIKYDGYRIGCLIEGRRIRLESRNGKDWTDAFPPIVDAARSLGVGRALIEGEAAILMADGRTGFQALQNWFAGGGEGLVYFAFDLLGSRESPGCWSAARGAQGDPAPPPRAAAVPSADHVARGARLPRRRVRGPGIAEAAARSHRPGCTAGWPKSA